MPDHEINCQLSKSHGQSVRQGIFRARADGVEWGRAGKTRAAENKATAQNYAESLRGTILALALQGHVFGPRNMILGNRLADTLNDLGIPSREEGRWHSTSARRLVQRLCPQLKADHKAAVQAKVDAFKQEMIAAIGDQKS